MKRFMMKTNQFAEDGNAHQVELDRKNIEDPVVADKKRKGKFL